MIRVLHVLKSSRYAGAENAAITICNGLGTPYKTAYASVDGPIAWCVRGAGLEFYPMRQFSIAEVKRVLQEFRPDIVHAHDYSASVFCAVLKNGYRLISHLHNNPPWIRSWSARSCAYAMTAGKMDRILTVSDEIRKEAVFLRRRKGIFVVSNPVDTARIRKRAEEFQPGTANTKNTNNIDLLFVGRLTKQKNPQRFIRVVSRLARGRRQRVSAVMLGCGELETECRRMVRRTGLSGYVRLLGFCENPYPYIRRARILLVTSDWEGYGIAAAEAIALGTPVLAMASGGLKTIFARFPEALCHSEEEMYRKAKRLLWERAAYTSFQEALCRNVSIVDLPDYQTGIRRIYDGL
ncbi:MAG: glycosyltransferase [Eubacterium sp.]|nr:glycosyltransferase [Eubacterium sp.]